MKTLKELREARRGKKIELEVNAVNIKREIELAMKDKTNWAGGNKNAMNWNFIDADVYYAIKPTQSKSKMYYKIFNNILDGILTKQNKLNKGMGNKLMKTGPRTRTVESVDEGLVGTAVRAVGRSVAQKAVAPKSTTSPTTISTEMSDLEKTRSIATTAGLKNKTPDQKKKERDANAKARADRPNPEMLGMGETSLNRMNLINKMKKASPAAKKALEAPSRVDKKDQKEAVGSADKKAETYTKPDGKIGTRMVRMDKNINNESKLPPAMAELTIDDVRRADILKKIRDRKDVQEMKEPSSDYNAKMDKIPVSQMTPAQKKANTERRKEYKAYQIKKGITPFVPHPDKVKEENLNELSPEVRQSYRKKAMANRNKADLDRTIGLMNKAKGKGRSTEKDIKKADDTLAKRNRGQALFNKQKDKNLPKSEGAMSRMAYQKTSGEKGTGLDTFKKKALSGKEKADASYKASQDKKFGPGGSYAKGAAQIRKLPGMKKRVSEDPGMDAMIAKNNAAQRAKRDAADPDAAKKRNDAMAKIQAKPNTGSTSMNKRNEGITFDKLRKGIVKTKDVGAKAKNIVKAKAMKTAKKAVIGGVAGLAVAKIAGY